MCAKKTNTLWSDSRIRLFALYTTPLSSLCRRMCRYWTSKIIAMCTLSSVRLTCSQFSQLSFMQYMGLCVFNIPISLMVIVRICVLYPIIIKLEVWPICHCFGVMSWNNGMCWMYLYILIAGKHFRMKSYMSHIYINQLITILLVTMLYNYHELFTGNFSLHHYVIIL